MTTFAKLEMDPTARAHAVTLLNRAMSAVGVVAVITLGYLSWVIF